MRHHIKKKRGYSDAVFDNIDWSAILHASKSSSLAERTWLMKHVGRYNPTGQQMLRRKQWSDSHCPRCDEPDEDSTHTLMCGQQEATELRGDLVLRMSDNLQKYDTLDTLRATIILTILDEDDDQFTSHVPEYDETYPAEIHQLLIKAATNQDDIGCKNFFSGHISTSWKAAQEAYFRLDKKNRRNGSTWSKRLIKSIYQTARTMWDHRNAALFANTQCKISKKRWQALLEEVDHELQVGHKGIRKKDAKIICFDHETVKGWQSTSIETWLTHIRSTRQRNLDQ